MSRQRAAITGWGVIAAESIGKEAFVETLSGGATAIDEVSAFDVEGLGPEHAAEVVDFDVKPWLRTPKNFLDRNSEFAFAACEMAVRDAGVTLPARDGDREGLALGSASANLATLAAFHQTLLAKGPRLAPPFVFPHTYANTTASLLSIEYELGGPHMVFTGGGAAGGQAIAYAMRAIGEGQSGLMVAGGVEALTEPLYRGASAAGWLSPTDGGDECCHPFSVGRNGAILGEGAALFVIEAEDRARRRNAKAKAWLLGSAIAGNAADAMSRAMATAGVDRAAVDLLVAAAGGYEAIDASEAGATRELLGEDCPVVAPKAVFGETLGAGGALNLAVALYALETGIVPANPGIYDSVAAGLCRESIARRPRIALIDAAHPDGGAWVTLVVGGVEEAD